MDYHTILTSMQDVNINLTEDLQYSPKAERHFHGEVPVGE